MNNSTPYAAQSRAPVYLPANRAKQRKPRTVTITEKNPHLHKYLFLAHVTGIFIGIGIESGKLQAILVAIFKILVGGSA